MDLRYLFYCSQYPITMKRVLALFTLFILSSHAAGWGDNANKMLCNDVVSSMWAKGALKCLDDTQAYCSEVSAYLGPLEGAACINALANGVDVHPATAPLNVFGDVENHVNYDDCPLSWVRETNKWVCDGSGNPAGFEANNWFQRAASAKNVCQQVRAFCTGAYYLSASYFPLNRVTHLTGCLGGSMDDLIDDELLSGDPGWEVRQQCVFSYMKQFAGRTLETTEHLSFVVNEADFLAMKSNLTVQAYYVQNPSLMPTTTTTVAAPITSTTSSTILTTTTSTTTTPPTTQHPTPLAPSSSTIQLLTTLIPSTTQPPTTLTPLTTLVPSTVQQTTYTAPSTTQMPITSSTVLTTSTVAVSTTLYVLGDHGGLNSSLEDIDVLFDEMFESINKTKSEGKSGSSNILMFGIVGLAFAVPVILSLYILHMVRAPAQVEERRVVLPLSARRRLRKSR